MNKFGEIARRFNVDPNDDEAVDSFFAHDVRSLSPEERESILTELLDADGEPDLPRVEADAVLPKNVRPLALTANEAVPVPPRALDPVRDGHELAALIQWMQRWLNDLLKLSGLGVIADVSLTSDKRVEVVLAGPDASRLESDEPAVLEALQHLTSRVAETIYPALDDLVIVTRTEDVEYTVAYGKRGLRISEMPKPPQIIEMEQKPIRAMSREKAAEALQSSSDQFIVFHDSETREFSVIYKRRDHNLGLIAPKRSLDE